MTKAFDGVRILELAQVISGPFAAGMLAYLGADVIKVEPPGDGDQARRMVDTGELAAAGVAPIFQGFNAGKRSVTVDLKKQEAREIIHRLVAQADVVIENSRPGSMRRLGYGYESLRAVKDDIIYCSISGYGQEGPRSGAAAYDGAIQAASGMMSITGEEGHGPMKAGFTVVDNATALTAAFAISSALFRRQRTGEGQFLDVSMLDTALSIMSPVITGYMIGGLEPAQTGNASLTRQPTGNVFPTGDGDLQVNAVTQPQVLAFCSGIGRADLLEDPRFSTLDARLMNADAMRAEIIAALASESAAHWETHLGALNVPAAKVLSIPDALRQPQLRHRDILLQIPAPDGIEGSPSTIVNVGFMASQDGPHIEGRVPRTGEHTDAVLAELGYSAVEVAAFREAGVV